MEKDIPGKAPLCECMQVMHAGRQKSIKIRQTDRRCFVGASRHFQGHSYKVHVHFYRTCLDRLHFIMPARPCHCVVVTLLCIHTPFDHHAVRQQYISDYRQSGLFSATHFCLSLLCTFAERETVNECTCRSHSTHSFIPLFHHSRPISNTFHCRMLFPLWVHCLFSIR